MKPSITWELQVELLFTRFDCFEYDDIRANNIALRIVEAVSAMRAWEEVGK